MTRLFSAALVFGVISAGAACAQTTTTNPSPNPSIIWITTVTDSENAAAPVAGANSFTESEARSRLEAHGYTDVTALMKDDQSIWRGKAMKDGKSVDIALDFQGNIVAQ
jgi:hypothetical protein